MPVLERRDWRCTRPRSWRCKAKTKAIESVWLPYVRVEDRRQAYVHTKTGRQIRRRTWLLYARAETGGRTCNVAPERAREDPKPTYVHAPVPSTHAWVRSKIHARKIHGGMSTSPPGARMTCFGLSVHETIDGGPGGSIF